MVYQIPDNAAWQSLASHHGEVRNLHMRDLFDCEPDRAKRYSIQAGCLYLDYSKNRVTRETLRLLCNLAEESDLRNAIRDLFSGKPVNTTENRPALHMLLRAADEDPWQQPDISDCVQTELRRATALHDRLVSGNVTGFSGEPIDTVVNMGIGGSDLGPRLVADALGSGSGNESRVCFVANVDPTEIHRVLASCRPETTLFIISSKSYTTLETRRNAESAANWLRDHGCPAGRVPDHFLAATANVEAAAADGVKRENIYRFWDWVGGRYSVWSMAGLAAFLAIGPDRFRLLLRGARQMDRHFHEAPFPENMPVLLALIGIWYVNFFDAASHAIIPYDRRLRMLPDYLCQLVMESNGKSAATTGESVHWHTAPVTWGGVGTNAQHSFFQALHQGTRLVPVDLLLPVRNTHDVNDQQAALYASCLAQSRALMTGTVPETGRDTPGHMVYPGNRPSNTILYRELDAEVLGALLALYEHKTYAQAVLWRINPFDQWGVELGKRITRSLLDSLSGTGDTGPELDSSTRSLLRRYRDGNG